MMCIASMELESTLSIAHLISQTRCGHLFRKSVSVSACSWEGMHSGQGREIQERKTSGDGLLPLPSHWAHEFITTTMARLTLLSLTPIFPSSHKTGDPNSSTHACAINILITLPFPQSHVNIV